MKNKRYTLLNEYYIQDNKTNKKLSQKQALDRLNHQERIIWMKTTLIKDLVKQNSLLEKQKKENKPIYIKPPKITLKPVNITPEDTNKIKQEALQRAIDSINLK
ncbi:hypothetical protein [Methanobrevibacter sp.]|uniref:hypothetical protein n=1 Tax=Methanobrevibacter sp. TaxID=66852 RepID=UPI00386E6903